MKVAILGDINSPHIQKWIIYLAKKDIEIILISLSTPTSNSDYPSNVKIYSLKLDNKIFQKKSDSLSKIKYISKVKRISKIIETEKPHILHAHYATSYGLIGVLLNFHPLVISVWGSDVFEFPRKNILYKYLFKYILLKADIVLSTSNFMAKELILYTKKRIEVTPFGIDLNIFNPQSRLPNKSTNEITIGIIKFLEKKYGVDYLIHAFKLVSDELYNYKLRLLIVGSGSQMDNLIKLVEELGLKDKVEFTGKIDHENIPLYHNQLDIAVYPSKSESFGVSVIESSACAVPVIASSIGGLPEVIENGVTGILVEPGNINKLSLVLKELIIDDNKRKNLGIAGRKMVKEKYDLQKNIDQMINIYKSIIK